MGEDITVDDIREAFPTLFKRFEGRINPQEIVRVLDEHGFVESEELVADLELVDAKNSGQDDICPDDSAAAVEEENVTISQTAEEPRRLATEEEGSDNEGVCKTLDLDVGGVAADEEDDEMEQGELYVEEILAQEVQQGRKRGSKKEAGPLAYKP
ncbi:unnamed protein product [Discosporangium mesarthrocarpum]